ncbi:MAG: hypothetical protein ACYTX0_00040 [Nostoc sp.]
MSTMVTELAVRAASRREGSRREVRATPEQHLQQQCSILQRKTAEICKPTS